MAATDSPRLSYANVVGRSNSDSNAPKNNTTNTNTGIPRPRCVILTLNDENLEGDDPRSKITETDVLDYVKQEIEIQGLFRVDNQMVCHM